ncbi:MAG: NAD(P)/FAD-dependent oxidoreductase [Pseudomonadota bacterium]
MSGHTRRRWLQRQGLLAGVLASGALGSGCSTTATGTGPVGERGARIAVIGGGFAGASCARALKSTRPDLAVTLFEPRRRYTACPLSNLALIGARTLSQQEFGYDDLRRVGVDVVHQAVAGIDPGSHTLSLDDGTAASWDLLVLATGIEIDYGALPGYDETAAARLPHAWLAGAQTRLLARQLRALPENGVVIITVPNNPYRCPPGPYERASLIAHYLKQAKPRAKLLVLDAKDRFSKQGLFQAAWAAHYDGILEWHGQADGATITAVDAARSAVLTEFEAITGDVINVIPPQHAGALARAAGLSDASGWCPIEVPSFRSTRAADVYVIGDAAIANGMPKSAFAANAQARLAALQILRQLDGLEPLDSKLLNTCYSLISPTLGISVADVYQPGARRWEPVAGAGGTSPARATTAVRQAEAVYARRWFEHLTGSVFGAPA